MRIKKVNYYSVPNSELGICSCCGKSIMNICCITTVENETFLFGTTCFNKKLKNNPHTYHIKKMQKILKNIKQYCDWRDLWKNLTEEDYYKNIKDIPFDYDKERFETFDECKKWIVEELIPTRIEYEEKELAKYSRLEI